MNFWVVKLYKMLKIILIEIAVFAIISFLLVYYFGEGFGDLKNAKPSFEMDFLKQGFVPQGICFSKDGFCFVSCYKKNTPSRIYIYSKDEKFVKFVNIEFNKQLLIAHFGGIEEFNGKIYISSDKMLFVCEAKDFFEKDVVCVTKQIETENNSDFCFENSGLIFAGEFYKTGKFETKDEHHLLIDGEKFSAICFGFKENNLCLEKPEVALAVPDLVQGIAVYKDKIFVSKSYGLSRSTLSVYDNVFLKQTKRKFVVGETAVPLYVLTNKDLISSLTLPSMSEEISICGDELFVIFENAANKYKLFTRTKLKCAYKFKIDKIKK